MKNRLFDIAVQKGWHWTVNGSIPDLEVRSYFNDDLLGMNCEEPLISSFCPYCDTFMESRAFDDVGEEIDDWHNNRRYDWSECPRCAHWEFSGTEAGNQCMDAQDIVILSSISAAFDVDFPAACNSEISQFLRRHPNKWHDLDPYRFERLVADVLKANHADSEVKHVGGPGDGGIDVYFVDSNQTKWLVQAKRRENPKKAEPVSTLRSILGTLVIEKERRGIVVSTSNSFSRQAKVARNRAAEDGFIIEMIDKGVLDRMVGALLPVPPWEEIFKHPDLGHVGDDVRKEFWPG